MKAFLIFAIAISSYLITYKSFGCTDGGDYEYKYFFDPSMLSDPSLVRFAPDWVTCDVCGSIIGKAILDEWNQKFPSCSDIDIKFALYSNLKADQIASLKSGSNPVPNNSFYNYLILNNQIEVIDYLDFITQENKLMIGADNNWDTPYWSEEEKDIKEGNRLLLLAKENLNATTDIFIKQRYIFQIVKLLHYVEKYKEAIVFFDENYANGHNYPLSLTYYRTLGYYAGAKRKSGNETQAKYLFATIFDKCGPISYIAYKNFKYIDQDEGQWSTCLSMAKNNAEKSAMLVAYNIYEFSIDVDLLKKLYETDSSSTRLELALLKQINNFHYENYIAQLKEPIQLDTNNLVKEFTYKGEIAKRNQVKSLNWFVRIWEAILTYLKQLFGKKDQGLLVWDDNAPDVTYEPLKYEDEWLGEMLELLEKIIKENKVSKPSFFILSKGYFQIVKGDFSEGEKTLSKIEKDVDSEIVKSAEYLRIWAKLLSAKVLNESLEDDIISYIKKNADSFELGGELAKRYYVEKQYTKAYQSIQRNEKIGYFSNSVLKLMIEKGDKNHSKIFKNYFGTLDNKELKKEYALRLLLTGRFKDANEIYNGKLEFYDMGEWNDDGELVGGRYFKPSITYKKIVELDKRGTAESYFQLAESLALSTTMEYNSQPWYNYYPYWFNETSRYPFNVKQIAEYSSNTFNYYTKLKYSTDLAESYYRKAHDLFTKDEDKARALIAAQTIAMHDKYAFKDLDYGSDETNKSYYYAEIREKYPNTNIVKALQNSCSFYRNENISYY